MSGVIVLLVIAFVVIASFCLTVQLTRDRVKWQPFGIVVTYLIWVGVTVAFAFLVHDEFGYSVLPALVIAAPWYFLDSVRSGLGMDDIGRDLAVGTIFNCAILYALVRGLGYARHSNQIAAQPVSAEESTDTP